MRLLADLPPFHRDPFDRMLICQAIQHALTIVTVDAAITQYPVATFGHKRPGS
jgi:PIN domain nuclease of toxin-antitoxin system